MLGGRRIGQQQTGKEIAFLRDPGTAAPPAPGALAFRSDPEWTVFALARQRQRLRIRRREELARNQPDPCCRCPGIELHHLRTATARRQWLPRPADRDRRRTRG